MRFTLNYDGPLPSRGNVASRVPIREALHPQLEELWNHDPLVGMRSSCLAQSPPPTGISVVRAIGGHVFAPLVCTQLCLMAELDILLLRPEAPGTILSRGDIDNSLKTLFDALRAPNNEQEVGGAARQSNWDFPTFTLLEDDRLISRVNVETDRLLNAAGHDQVRLTIQVTLRPSKVIYGNQVLIS